MALQCHAATAADEKAGRLGWRRTMAEGQPVATTVLPALPARLRSGASVTGRASRRSSGAGAVSSPCALNIGAVGHGGKRAAHRPGGVGAVRGRHTRAPDQDRDRYVLGLDHWGLGSVYGWRWPTGRVTGRLEAVATCVGAIPDLTSSRAGRDQRGLSSTPIIARRGELLVHARLAAVFPTMPSSCGEVRGQVGNVPDVIVCGPLPGVRATGRAGRCPDAPRPSAGGPWPWAGGTVRRRRAPVSPRCPASAG